MELLGESGLATKEKLTHVKEKTGELKGIFVAIVRNTKAKSQTQDLMAKGMAVPLVVKNLTGEAAYGRR